MTEPGPPTLEEQIEAVKWALAHLPDMGRGGLAEIAEMQRRLEAAAETLGHLEFMRETAR